MVGIPLSWYFLPIHGVQRVASSAPGLADQIRAFPIGRTSTAIDRRRLGQWHSRARLQVSQG
ncbi:unnamed protein product [Prunus armeniaca]